jgi:hypothetical protein
MPRKSKAAHSRTKNLGSGVQRSKQLKQASATIEEVKDTGEFVPEHVSIPRVSADQRDRRTSEEGFIFEDKDGSLTLVGFLEEDHSLPLADFTSEADSDEEDEMGVEDGYPEIRELSDPEEFSKILAEAQRVAVEAEDERLKDNNRPKQYFKNSARTRR